MKKRITGKYGVLAVLLAVLLVLSSCSSMVESIGKLDSAVDRTKARANQAALDAVGVGAMEDAMVASMVYAQVFFAGGFAYGYEDFEEGEGVIWKLTSTDESGSESMEAERALLKRTADNNEWWLLSYSEPEGESFLSEALLDPDYSIVKFRYMDPETEKIREWVPETDEEAAAEETQDEAEAEETAYAGEEALFRGDYENYIVGQETVRVGAGTYTADHVLIEDTYTIYTDEEETEENAETYQVIYEWWISDDVPGQIVKYEWQNVTEKISLKGELVSFKKGYTTQLESF